MSRLRLYTRSLISGYALLAVNTLFTFASVPLALQYLSKAEFGLWALTSQVAGYLVLLDFGMSGAQSRILIDYKDGTEGTNYGSTILTGLLVGSVQGLLLLIAGGLAVWGLKSVPGIPAAFETDFLWLMFGQCLLLAATLITRVFGNVLWAHQRTDIANIAQIVQFTANFAGLWAGFAFGAGVYSLLWGLALSTVTGFALTLAACLQMRLLPARGRWGRPSRERFVELFGFGKDIFLVALGGQMINTSQAIVVAPMLGLDAAGVWSISVRTYGVVCQMVWRLLDFSATPLSEMHVRGERQRFFERFREVTVLTGAASAAGAVMFAACNQPFLEVWTGGKVAWSRWNDVLLGIWAVLMAIQRCHCGILGVTKQLATVKYVYFAEGLGFFALVWWLGPKAGFAGVIGSSVLATFLFSFLYGQWRTRSTFQLSWKALFRWLGPMAITAIVLACAASGVLALTSDLRPLAQLVVFAGTIAPLGAWVLARYGLAPSMRRQLSERLPAWLRPLLTSVIIGRVG